MVVEVCAAQHPESHDAFHECELHWRGIRDFEAVLEGPVPDEPPPAWLAEILVDPEADPRCSRCDPQPSGSIPGVYALQDIAVEGAFIVPQAVSQEQQRTLLSELVMAWFRPPNRSNLWPRFASEAELECGLASFAQEGREEGVEKLRWVTLGRQYDWGARTYLDEAPPLPRALSSLADAVVASMPLPPEAEVQPFDAAICNLYHSARRPSDRLGGHTDEVEPNAASPLVTISLGLPCIFLLGGRTRDQKPTPILLRSGSALVMAGGARHAYHGVPTVLVPPQLQPRGRGHPRNPRRRPGGDGHRDVYSPWQTGCGSAAGAPSASLDDVFVAAPSACDGAVDHLLTKVRVSFSIRSVVSCSPESAAGPS